MLTKIVSGGQTGVDRGALDAALAVGFPCGGWCPADRSAEDGPIPSSYPLTPLTAGGYRERTVRNVLDSDGTLILYFGVLNGGTEQTMLHCVRRHKAYQLIDGQVVDAPSAAEIAAAFVRRCGVAVLNVAGPREQRAGRLRLCADGDSGVVEDRCRGLPRRVIAHRFEHEAAVGVADIGLHDREAASAVNDRRSYPE